MTSCVSLSGRRPLGFHTGSHTMTRRGQNTHFGSITLRHPTQTHKKTTGGRTQKVNFAVEERTRATCWVVWRRAVQGKGGPAVEGIGDSVKHGFWAENTSAHSVRFAKRNTFICCLCNPYTVELTGLDTQQSHDNTLTHTHTPQPNNTTTHNNNNHNAHTRTRTSFPPSSVVSCWSILNCRSLLVTIL